MRRSNTHFGWDLDGTVECTQNIFLLIECRLAEFELRWIFVLKVEHVGIFVFKIQVIQLLYKNYSQWIIKIEHHPKYIPNEPEPFLFPKFTIFHFLNDRKISTVHTMASIRKTACHMDINYRGPCLCTFQRCVEHADTYCDFEMEYYTKKKRYFFFTIVYTFAGRFVW